MKENIIDKGLLHKSILEFKSHFEIEENKRIIFSSPFGTGKTTFLKKYFEDQNSYQAIKLFPVNYSVASNEDIFQLIKYDILFQILGTDVTLEQTEFTHLETLGTYLPERIDEVFGALLNFIPKTGNLLTEKVKPIFDLYKNYRNYHSAIKHKNEEEEIIRFLLDFTQEKGNIYEEDFITLLIRDLISSISKSPKKTVLIIDDLDRLDPEHIFRILNILSAHFDHNNTDENKFGFEKIILVCDIENIRAIFRHKYGLNTDFSGYIDKFYVKEIFNFTNHYSLMGWLDGLNGKSNSTRFNHINKSDIDFIYTITKHLSSTGKITFRNLLKLDYTSLEADFNRVYKNCTNRDFFCFPLTRVAYLLKLLFGDLNFLLERLQEMHNIHFYRTEKQIGEHPTEIFGYYNVYLFPVLSYKIHNFKNDFSFQFNYESSLEASASINLTSRKSERNLSTVAATEYPYANRDFWKDLQKSINILSEKNAV